MNAGSAAREGVGLDLIPWNLKTFESARWDGLLCARGLGNFAMLHELICWVHVDGLVGAPMALWSGARGFQNESDRHALSGTMAHVGYRHAL